MKYFELNNTKKDSEAILINQIITRLILNHKLTYLLAAKKSR